MYILLTFSRLAAAILCAVLTFTVWNIGTRSPAQAAQDFAEAAKRGSVSALAVVRFAGGALFLLLSAAMVMAVLPESELQRFTIYEIVVLVVGLAVEILVGEDLRAVLHLKR